MNRTINLDGKNVKMDVVYWETVGGAGRAMCVWRWNPREKQMGRSLREAAGQAKPINGGGSCSGRLDTLTRRWLRAKASTPTDLPKLWGAAEGDKHILGALVTLHGAGLTSKVHEVKPVTEKARTEEESQNQLYLHTLPMTAKTWIMLSIESISFWISFYFIWLLHTVFILLLWYQNGRDIHIDTDLYLVYT